jgi:hypothetical protein
MPAKDKGGALAKLTPFKNLCYLAISAVRCMSHLEKNPFRKLRR